MFVLDHSHGHGKESHGDHCEGKIFVRLCSVNLSCHLFAYIISSLGHHEHKGHEHTASDHHDHDHGHKEHAADDEMPAWKRQALEAGSDPTAAPFGGTWDTGSSLSASDGGVKKMEE